MITFSKQIKKLGSNCITINVSKNGQPYGIIRTFKDTKFNHSPWQVILLDGRTEDFWGIWRNTASKREALKKAKAFV